MKTNNRFKLLDIIRDDNGVMSSTRVITLIFTFCIAIDWINAVFTKGAWSPDWQVITFYLSIMGFKLGQKPIEINKTNIVK